MKCPHCGKEIESFGYTLTKDIEMILKETNEKMFFEDIYKSLIKRNNEYEKRNPVRLAQYLGANKHNFPYIKTEYVSGYYGKNGCYLTNKAFYFYSEIPDPIDIVCDCGLVVRCKKDEKNICPNCNKLITFLGESCG